MSEKQVNTVIGIIYLVAAVLVLTGAFFKLQHSPNGLSMLFLGFGVGSMISAYDRFRLKKKIKRLEEQLNQNNL